MHFREADLGRIFVGAAIERTYPYLEAHRDHILRLPTRAGTLRTGPGGKPDLRILTCSQGQTDLEQCRSDLEPQRKPGERLFRVTRPLDVPGQDRLLTVLDHEGWESNPAPLAVWRRQGDELVLEGIGDHVFQAGLSKVELLEVKPLGSEDLVVIGQTWGGDGGEMWRTVWIARWRAPDHLQVVFSAQATGGSSRAIAIEHHLHPDLRLDLRVPPSDIAFEPDQAFSITLDLMSLFRRLDAGEDLAEIHRTNGWMIPWNRPH